MLSEWVRGKRERGESETLVFKTGWMWKFESRCAQARQLPGPSASVTATHSRHVWSALCCHFGRRSYFYFEPLHTENVLRSSSSSSLTPLEEDNCSWHICGWAPTLDKDYRRYKSWTMAPLLTQNWKIALIFIIIIMVGIFVCVAASPGSLSHAWSSLEMCQASQHWSLAVSHCLICLMLSCVLSPCKYSQE